MKIDRYLPDHRMSQAVVHGDRVYLAGQVSINGGDIKEQARETFANVDKVLEGVGSDKSKILSATIWLKDISDWAAMNEVWDAWIDPDNPPARATVQAALAGEEFLIEVMIVAAA